MYDKKKLLGKFYVFLIIFSLFLGCIAVFVPSVVGASGTTVVETWDSTTDSDYNIGRTSGDNSYWEWYSNPNGACAVNATHYMSGTKSFRLSSDVGAVSSFFNFTDTMGYISMIEIHVWLYVVDRSFNISFYNNSESVLELNISGTANAIKYRGYDGTLNTIYAGGEDNNEWNTIRITHNYGNNMRYQLFRNSDGLPYGDVNGTTYVADSDDWYGFTSMRISSPAGAGTAYMWFDTFNVTTSSGSSETFGQATDDLSPYCSGGADNFGSGGVGDQYIECQFVGSITKTIYQVDLPIGIDQYSFSPGLSGYHMYVNGVPWGSPDYAIEYSDYCYILRWVSELGTSLVNEKPIFSFKSDNYYVAGGGNYYWYSVGKNPSVYIAPSRSHNIESYYLDTSLNGGSFPSGQISMCYYYNGTVYQEEPIIDSTVLAGYKTAFGSSTYNYTFIQFKNFDMQCYHGVGDSPNIIYYVTDDYVSSSYNVYYYRIMKVGVSAPVYTGAITLTGTTKSADFVDTSYVFSSVGQYYIILYNTSDYGTAIDTFLYTSQKITVCEISSSSVSNTETVEQTNYDILIGFFISIGVGVGLFIVTHSPIGLLVGSISTAFIFSQGAMGTYQLLPESLGYALIVILVLIGVVVWLFD